MMLPVLSPISPPAVPFVPTLTAPLAQVWPATQSRFAGTVVPAIVPAFCPTSPPAKAELPPATLPVAKELLMAAPRRLEPTRPPTELNAPPLTAPVAEESRDQSLVGGDEPADDAVVAGLHAPECGR